jgi:stalled ribosome rescue protein Dom34
MKILKRFIDKKYKGYITFIPEEDEDLWFLYNIIKSQDVVRLKINRKIQQESATGFVKTQKKFILAKLEVLEVDFDFDSKGTGLFIKSKNIDKNDYIELGSMQSVAVELFFPITVCKLHLWPAIRF